MAEHIPNLKKETEIQVQEAQRVPNKVNPNRSTPSHTVIKMANVKDKERILKAVREKQRISYKGTPIRLPADFSAEILQDRREWHDIFKDLNRKPATKDTLTSMIIIQNRRRDKEFLKQAKTKRIQQY